MHVRLHQSKGMPITGVLHIVESQGHRCDKQNWLQTICGSNCKVTETVCNYHVRGINVCLQY